MNISRRKLSSCLLVLERGPHLAIVNFSAPKPMRLGEEEMYEIDNRQGGGEIATLE